MCCEHQESFPYYDYGYDIDGNIFIYHLISPSMFKTQNWQRIYYDRVFLSKAANLGHFFENMVGNISQNITT